MSAVLERLAEQVGASERTLRRAVSDGTIRAHRPSPKRLLIAPEEAEYVREHWAELGRLRALLRTEPNVAFACLFGSVARGSESSESDLDLLVMLRRASPLALAQLAERIERRTGRSAQLVSLRDAQRHPGLLLTILRDGRVLVDRDGAWQRLQDDLPRLRRAAAAEEQELARRADEAAEFFTQLAAETGRASP